MHDRLTTITKLDDRIQSAMDALNVPGVALAMIKDGEIAAIRTYGLADKASATPVTEETLFSLQSISKSLAAWGVMALVEDGRVDLDRPFDDYATPWRLPVTRFDRRLVTLRRLLSHHAGISVSGFPGMTDAFPHVTLIDGLSGNLPPLSDEQAAYWRKWNLGTDWAAHVAYPPGEGWHYSNAGFGMLELIVESVTGATFASFMESRVLRPLGLDRATYNPGAASSVATAYAEDGSVRQPLRYLSHAAAGLYSTIGDLATFACASLRQAGRRPGRGVIREESLAEMFTPHGLADRTPDYQFETGLGHLLLSQGGRLNVHHSGGSIGWRSIFSIYPELGDGICMLVNSDGGNALWQPIVRAWREEIVAGN